MREDKKVDRRRWVGRGGMEVGGGGGVEALHQAVVLGTAGERVRATDDERKEVRGVLLLEETVVGAGGGSTE